MYVFTFCSGFLPMIEELQTDDVGKLEYMRGVVMVADILGVRLQTWCNNRKLQGNGFLVEQPNSRLCPCTQW